MSGCWWCGKASLLVAVEGRSGRYCLRHAKHIALNPELGVLVEGVERLAVAFGSRRLRANVKPWQERPCSRCSRPSYRAIGSEAMCRWCWESVMRVLGTDAVVADEAVRLVDRLGLASSTAVAERVLTYAARQFAELESRAA